MGYSTPFTAVSRKIADNIVITSCPFSILNKLNVGARMAVFSYGSRVVVWSPIPYGDEFEKAVRLLIPSGDYDVAYIIVVNTQHNLAACEYKERFPDAQVLGAASIKLKGDKEVDVKFTSAVGDRLLDRNALETELALADSLILDNFQFVYMSKSKNRELVVYETNAQVLLVGDVLFNLGRPGTTDGSVVLEQFSPAAGISQPFYPHSGWSFLSRYMQPESKVGTWIMNDVVQSKLSETQAALRAVQELDFKQIVLCHGDIIDSDAKGSFKKVFKI